VIVGSGDGRIYMVDIEKGTKLWSYEIGSAIVSSPAVVKNMLIVTAMNGSIYAFGTK
jgi:outer membrane protein assembly factor BamB